MKSALAPHEKSGLDPILASNPDSARWLTPTGLRVDRADVATPAIEHVSPPLESAGTAASGTALLETTEAPGHPPGVFADLCELVKARLTSLVLVTTVAGYYLGSTAPLQVGRMLNTLVGTALAAGGAAALNELMERRSDAVMHRTRDRPLPAGRISPDAALLIGAGLVAAGLLYLNLQVNLLSAGLAAATVATYLFAYTPLKRRTSLNTLVGAIPGALPPMIGWAAARGTVEPGAWSLFAILFCWQLPHFLAIASMYRDDYARAGFVMLTNLDETGHVTGRQAVNYSAALLLVSLLPGVLGLAGRLFFFGAFVLGLGMFYRAIQMQLNPTREAARRLFFASIIYLPLFLALLALDKLPRAG